MSEYKKQTDVSKLIGAPPGYVGYNVDRYDAKGTLLTTRVNNDPEAVIIFDEIDKIFEAAMTTGSVYERTVLDILLQILEDGRLTDTYGVTANFSRTIIFFTSNGGVNLELIEINVCTL